MWEFSNSFRRHDVHQLGALAEEALHLVKINLAGHVLIFLDPPRLWCPILRAPTSPATTRT